MMATRGGVNAEKLKFLAVHFGDDWSMMLVVDGDDDGWLLVDKW